MAKIDVTGEGRKTLEDMIEWIRENEFVDNLRAEIELRDETISTLESKVEARDLRIERLTRRCEALERAAATPYDQGHRRLRGQVGQ